MGCVHGGWFPRKVEVLHRHRSELVQAMDQCGGGPCSFPAQALVDRAWSEGRALLTLPWLTAFLAMMRWDLVSPRTRHYQRLFARLRAMLHELYSHHQALPPAQVRCCHHPSAIHCL